MLIAIVSAYGQVVDIETKRTIYLYNGWSVDVYGKGSVKVLNERSKSGITSTIENLKTADPIETNENKYYYVPPAQSLRIKKNKSGKPLFGYYDFIVDANANKNAQGGLLNFHVTFGLTKEQEIELETKLNADVPGAKILGSVPLRPVAGKANGEFTITSGSLGDLDKIAKSKAPIAQGEVAALSAALTDIESQKLSAMLKSEIPAKDVFFNLNYTFPCAIQAASGGIVVHQDRFQTMMDSIVFEKEQGGTEIPIISNNRYVTEDGLREIYNRGTETNIIEVEFIKNTTEDDDNINQVITAFFEFFKTSTSFIQRVPFKQIELPLDSFPEGPNVPYYEIRKELRAAESINSETTTNLSYRMTLPMGIQISGGLSEWMSEYNLEDCMETITLDDEKWTSKNIIIELDAEVQPLLGDEINAVEVALRKRRGDNYYRFADQGGAVIYTAKTIKDVLETGTRQYSRVGPESDTYEYKTTWKFKGSVTEESDWISTSDESIPLECPLNTKNINFVIPADELQSYDINMAAIEIRYIKAKKERTESLVLILAKDLVNIEKSIVMDAEIESYATRYTFNVKGKNYITPWQDSPSSVDYFHFDISSAIEMIENQDFGTDNNTNSNDLLNELGYLK